MNGTNLYAIAATAGPVKIGTSTSIPRRLAALQTGNADQLELVFAMEIPTDEAFLRERYAHFLAEQRVAGEWFAISRPEAIAIVRSACSDDIEDIMGVLRPSRSGTPAKYPDVDPKAIRLDLGLTQAAFAEQFGLSLGWVRDHEQGRVPLAPWQRVLYAVIIHDPVAVRRANGLV